MNILTEFLRPYYPGLYNHLFPDNEYNEENISKFLESLYNQTKEKFPYVNMDRQDHSLFFEKELLPYFEEKEEYEKCANIKRLINKIKNDELQ